MVVGTGTIVSLAWDPAKGNGKGWDNSRKLIFFITPRSEGIGSDLIKYKTRRVGSTRRTGLKGRKQNFNKYLAPLAATQSSNNGLAYPE